MAKKENSFDPYAILKKGKTIYRTGVALFTLLFVYVILMGWELLPEILWDEFWDFAIVFVVSWGIGIPVILYGRPIKMRGERYMNYMAIANDDNKIFRVSGGLIKQNELPDLANIARMFNTSEPVVHRELEELISNGYMKGCYINEELHALVTPNNAKMADNIKTLECKYCGARNEYTPGKETFCVNCGAVLRI